MLEGLFALLEAYLLKSTIIMLLASFVWGFLSIMLSPCHLSGIPIAILSSQKISPRPNLVPGLFAVGIVLSLLIAAILTFTLGQSLLMFSISSSWVLTVVLLLSGLIMLDLIPLNFSIAQPKLKSGFILQPISLGLFFGLLVGPLYISFRNANHRCVWYYIRFIDCIRAISLFFIRYWPRHRNCHFWHITPKNFRLAGEKEIN
jgi:cytochrome c-type biogenesis protein